jgi:citrate synthase
MLALTDAVREELGHEPTLDLGLAAVAEACALPDGAAFAIFAIGRAVGWIAHATEQYAEGRLIRPRARYVGPPPASTTAGPGARATGGQASRVVSA